MSKTVEQLALEALEAEERPKREAEERENREALERKQREKIRTRELDIERLRNSPVPKWFPTVSWEPIDHFEGWVVYEALGQPRDEAIRLMIGAPGTMDQNHVKWADQDWLDRPGGRIHGWDGPKVGSAADVGRQVQRWRDIMASMPAYLP